MIAAGGEIEAKRTEQQGAFVLFRKTGRVFSHAPTMVRHCWVMTPRPGSSSDRCAPAGFSIERHFQFHAVKAAGLEFS